MENDLDSSPGNGESYLVSSPGMGRVIHITYLGWGRGLTHLGIERVTGTAYLGIEKILRQFTWDGRVIETGQLGMGKLIQTNHMGSVTRTAGGGESV